MNYNEIKKKQSPEAFTSEPEETSTALEGLRKRAQEQEMSLENALLRKALAESLEESKQLKAEFLELAKNQNEEIKKLRLKVEKTESKFEKLMQYTELALEKLLGNAFKNVIDKTDKNAEKVQLQTDKYCQSLSNAAANAWGEINSIKYIVVGCLVAFVTLGCYTAYSIRELTYDMWKQSSQTTDILTGKQKYWFNEKEQQLYLKYVEDQRNASKTR